MTILHVIPKIYQKPPSTTACTLNLPLLLPPTAHIVSLAISTYYHLLHYLLWNAFAYLEGLTAKGTDQWSRLGLNLYSRVLGIPGGEERAELVLPGMLVYTCNPNVLKAKAGEPWV